MLSGLIYLMDDILKRKWKQSGFYVNIIPKNSGLIKMTRPLPEILPLLK